VLHYGRKNEIRSSTSEANSKFEIQIPELHFDTLRETLSEKRVEAMAIHSAHDGVRAESNRIEDTQQLLV